MTVRFRKRKIHKDRLIKAKTLRGNDIYRKRQASWDSERWIDRYKGRQQKNSHRS